MIDLTIITVTYFSEKQIETLIRSVQAGCSAIRFEHIIIDNGSSDKTVPLIQSFGESVIFLKNKINVGFSKANQLGYLKAKGRYLLFLNPDMEVEEKSLDKLVDWMDEHPHVGIAGCKLVDQAGEFNQEAAPRRFPRLWEQWVILLKLQKFFPKALNRYFYKDIDFSKEQPVESVRGSFMLMRKQLADLLGWAFDPRYFIWFEDVDVCREAQKHGYTVMYTPIVQCKDAIGQSFQQRNRRWRFKQYAKSLWTYLKKWEPFYVWCWVPLFYLPIAMLIGSKSYEKVKRLIESER